MTITRRWIRPGRDLDASAPLLAGSGGAAAPHESDCRKTKRKYRQRARLGHRIMHCNDIERSKISSRRGTANRIAQRTGLQERFVDLQFDRIGVERGDEPSGQIIDHIDDAAVRTEPIDVIEHKRITGNDPLLSLSLTLDVAVQVLLTVVPQTVAAACLGVNDAVVSMAVNKTAQKVFIVSCIGSSFG